MWEIYSILELFAAANNIQAHNCQVIKSDNYGPVLMKTDIVFSTPCLSVVYGYSGLLLLTHGPQGAAG